MEVAIKIKDPILRAYLNGLFELRDGLYVATMDTFTGAVICTLARPCDCPPKQEMSDSTELVDFKLSKSHYNDELRSRFLYISPAAQAKVNLVLRKEFDCNFTAFCVESRILGIPLKDSIDQFMVENNMDEFFGGEIETLKKKFYRQELATMRNARDRLRKKAYYALNRAVKNINISKNVDL